MMHASSRFPQFAATALALAAVAGAQPVAAQIYKWVDAHGVVNYGESPPPGRVSRIVVPERNAVSVYTPPAPAVAAPAGADAELKQRLDQLERQLARERQAQDRAAQLAAEREALRIEQCRQERRVDCDEDVVLGLPYSSVLVLQRPPQRLHRPHQRPRSLPQRAQARERETREAVGPMPGLR